VLRSAAAAVAEHADTDRIVDDDQRVVLVGELADRNVTIREPASRTPSARLGWMPPSQMMQSRAPNSGANTPMFA
jgi:hypothetical protein